MVNATSVARERDIAVTTVHQDQVEGYQTLVRLTVQTERGERSIAGTLFQERRPRVVAVRDIPVEAELGPHMLFVRNEDKPGFIGKLGQILGDAGINIATFHVGRTAPGEEALALVEVDQEISGELLESICALPHTMQCKALRF
jgi:D-3-phosphoglycerate dehydrogenase